MQVFNKTRLPWGIDYKGRVMTIPADGQLHVLPDDVEVGQFGEAIQIVVPPPTKTEDREDVKKLLLMSIPVPTQEPAVVKVDDGANVVSLSLDDIPTKTEPTIEQTPVVKPKTIVKKTTFH